AGIEEALTQIYYTGITNLSANNWTWGTDGFYHKTRSVGNDGSYYEVVINPVDPPVIVSTAYARAPLVPSSAFGMILGTVSSGGPPNPYVKRRVQVNTSTQGIEPGYRTDDENMEILDVKEPFSGNYFTPVSHKVGKTKYDYALPLDGNYKLSSISGKVLVTGNATLWVTDSVAFATG